MVPAKLLFSLPGFQPTLIFAAQMMGAGILFAKFSKNACQIIFLFLSRSNCHHSIILFFVDKTTIENYNKNMSMAFSDLPLIKKMWRKASLKNRGEMMSTVFQQVLQKGEEKNKLRVALNCLKKGMDIQTIAEITDLPIERIELLKTVFQTENDGHR